MVYFLTNGILNGFDAFTPLKTVRVKRPPVPWIIDDIKIMINLRDKALAKYKQIIEKIYGNTTKN